MLHREDDLQMNRVPVAIWTILRVVAAVLFLGWAALRHAGAETHVVQLATYRAQGRSRCPAGFHGR